MKLRYKPSKDAPEALIEVDDSRVIEVWDRATKKFCAPLTVADRLRFEEVKRKWKIK